MIEVTLDDKPDSTYRIGWNGKNYEFKGQVPVYDVPEDLARYCQTLTTGKHKRPLFRVEGLDGDPDADVVEFLGIQERWTYWPSTQP